MVLHIFDGQLPPKEPSHSSEGISYARAWEVAEKCWKYYFEDRISMEEARAMLQTSDADADVGSADRSSIHPVQSNPGTNIPEPVPMSKSEGAQLQKAPPLPDDLVQVPAASQPQSPRKRPFLHFLKKLACR